MMALNYITFSLLIIFIPLSILGLFVSYGKIDIDLFSTLLVIVLAIAGYVYQSGENRKIQDLEYKRNTYALLMQNLAVFKRTGKNDALIRDAEKSYYRSWVETSDDVNKKMLDYFNAYTEWTNNKTPENTQNEQRAFNVLVNQIKQEICPRSRAKFTPFYFQLKDSDKS